MAKIAVERKSPKTRLISSAEGWRVCDAVCTTGPGDRAFEEYHSRICVAVVLAGSFQYRTTMGQALMTPGSILLGNSGEPFICRHEHGTGDHCISFQYSEELAADAELDSRRRHFRTPRIPPIRAMSSVVARIEDILRPGADHAIMPELAFQLFDLAIRAQHGSALSHPRSEPAHSGRVTQILRAIEATPEAPYTLADMAASARLSPWHFLRCFEELTGTTPRQYLLRLRLRKAAFMLKRDSSKIVDIAFDSGFGDVSNFNRMFRAEFGVSPRSYRCE